MEYMIQDCETKENYLLSEYRKAVIKSKIRQGFLSAKTGDFLYTVDVTFSLNCKATIQDLSPKAKKYLCHYLSQVLLGADGATAVSETVRVDRGDKGLSIADLKSFKAPLFKNGTTFIILDINAKINFKVK